MNCFKCGEPLSIPDQADILDSEAELSASLRRPFKLPDEFRLCSDCIDLSTGEVEVS